MKTKDIEAYQIEQLQKRNKVAVSDDSIVLRVAKEGDSKIKKAEHNGFRGGVGLTDDYYQFMYRTDKIIGYWNQSTQTSYRADQKELAIQNGAVPKYTKKIDLGLDTYFEIFDSYCEAVVNDLYIDMKSRYRKGLNQICNLMDLGIIKYSGKSDNRATRIEAMRQRLKRDWLVSRYDWNLLILDENIGLELLKNLHPYNQDTSREAGETVYLSGFNDSDSILIRIYNTKYKTGKNIVKIEISLRKNFLKLKRKNKETGEDYNYRNPTLFLTQPEIQEQTPIYKALKKAVKEVITKGKISDQLSRSLQVNKTGLYDELLRKDRTFTYLLPSKQAIEQEQLIQENLEKLKARRDRKLSSEASDRLSDRLNDDLNSMFTTGAIKNEQ